VPKPEQRHVPEGISGIQDTQFAEKTHFVIETFPQRLKAAIDFAGPHPFKARAQSEFFTKLCSPDSCGQTHPAGLPGPWAEGHFQIF
jgi:hypothetical protein